MSLKYLDQIRNDKITLKTWTTVKHGNHFSSLNNDYNNFNKCFGPVFKLIICNSSLQRRCHQVLQRLCRLIVVLTPFYLFWCYILSRIAIKRVLKWAKNIFTIFKQLGKMLIAIYFLNQCGLCFFFLFFSFLFYRLSWWYTLIQCAIKRLNFFISLKELGEMLMAKNYLNQCLLDYVSTNCLLFFLWYIIVCNVISQN